MVDQIQCCLKYTRPGLKFDTIRLVSLEQRDWAELRDWAGAHVGSIPALEGLVRQDIPVFVPRQELLRITDELKRSGGQPAGQHTLPDGWFMLVNFLVNAADQREAGVLFDIQPGVRHETHTYIKPGTDVLGDLESLSRGAQTSP